MENIDKINTVDTIRNDYTINVDDIIISKPKKSDNSLLCSIYYNSKKEKPTITMKNMFVIGTKPLSHRNEFFIYIKNHNYNNFIFDLNKYLINIIRDKSTSWFNSNLNADLIEDLYTNTIIYDKHYGDIIRLKCVGEQEHILEEIKNKHIDINITFNHIRFYKQKFVLECEINTFEISEDIFINYYDEEQPSPTYEDIKQIKKEHFKIIDIVLDNLKENLHILEHKILITETLKSELFKTTDIENITKLCNELEKLWE